MEKKKFLMVAMLTLPVYTADWINLWHNIWFIMEIINLDQFN